MRRVEAILAAAIAISLTGCVLRGKPKAALTVPVPAPSPAPAPAAPPPAPPQLSIPQTTVELPPPQPPLSQEALNSTQPPEETPAAPAVRTRTPPKSRPGTVAAAPRTETVGPSVPAVALPPADPPRAPLQEIVPAAEKNKLQADAEKSRKSAQVVLDQIRRHKVALNAQQQSRKEQVLAFLHSSEQAEREGDMQKAFQLAERGLLIAKELPGGK